ncbi:response regulator transcription factor [Flavobacterium ajazii]|uniref:response regulator transcription factor n=1 Tax=Flavobacterium ajazii TaxID=2692318 RepID=UPI0013D70C3D|nr:helix-turn-helix transcriptional regulator [Flavobacterium ajazii]
MKDPNLNSFFDSRNIIEGLTNEEKAQKNDYLEPIKAFARATYTSIYVIDYLEQGFEFVSDNPLFLCGNTPQEVLEMGYAFYFKHVPPVDLELLLKVNSVGFDFYEKIPHEERILYTISYDFHLKNQEGKLILINQKLTPVFLTNTGKIWKAICVISLSSERKAGNIKIHKNGENKVHNYNLAKDHWEESKKVSLSKRETEILQLSSRGFTINEIADVLFISPDTVKFHRRKLFEKLEVTNISEAIAFVTGNKLI